MGDHDESIMGVCGCGGEEQGREEQGSKTASTLEKLFGKTIQTKDGPKPTSKVLANKTNVMIYFSAHWCPPCRGFTPVLSEAYTASAKAGNETAIVFMSSDRDQASF